MYNKIKQEDIERLERKRNRVKIFIRIITGIKRIFTSFHIITLLVMIVAFMAMWHYRTVLLFWDGLPIILSKVYVMAVDILAGLLIFIIALLVIMKIGTPRKAKIYEDCLLSIGFFSYIGHTAFLISRKRLKNCKVFRLEFYSRGIAYEEWERRISEIQDVLCLSLVDTIKYGRNQNHIVLFVKEGKPNQATVEVIDDDDF